jgi:hypothetical protein
LIVAWQQNGCASGEMLVPLPCNAAYLYQRRVAHPLFIEHAKNTMISIGELLVAVLFWTYKKH